MNVKMTITLPIAASNAFLRSASASNDTFLQDQLQKFVLVMIGIITDKNKLANINLGVFVSFLYLDLGL